MAYRLEVKLCFVFHNSLLNSFLQVLNNSSLDVNAMTFAESSQDLREDAVYLHLCIKKSFGTFTNTTKQYSNKRRTAAAALIRGRRLFTLR